MNKLFQIISFGFSKMNGGKKKRRCRRKKDNFFTRLLKEDNNLSALNFFLIATLCVGVFLLFIPVIGMLVDIWFNHTMTINLSDMALYIGAVAGIFASGGLTSAWTEFSYSKYNVAPIKDDNHNGIPDDEEEDEDTYIAEEPINTE